jgi:MFS family permease
MNDIEQSGMLASEKRAVTVVALVAMCRMLGLFALLPVLAVYANHLPGATPMLVGLAVGGYGLTQAVLQIPFGALSDRIGRMPVLLMGLAIFALGSIVAGFADTIVGVIVGRLLQGAGAISATLTALLADSTREKVRTRSMAFMGMSIGMSFLIAFILGPLIAGYFGERSLFWMAALLAGFAAALLGLLPKTPRRPEVKQRLTFSAAFLPNLLRLDLYVFLLHTILTASFVALPFVLHDHLQLPMTAYWKIYIGALLLSLLGTIPLIMADERQGKRWTMGIAVALLIGGQVVLATVNFSTWSVLAALCIFFAGFNFLEAGLPSRLSLAAHGDVRGAALGVFASSQFLGAFAGGITGGILLGYGSPETVFAACALLAGIWLLVQQMTEKA